MITQGEHQKVYDALAMEECCYLLDHPLEVFCQLSWDGMRWRQEVELARQGRWTDHKQYMDTMGETYLREVMKTVIESVSTRLYREYWSTCLNPPVVDRDDKNERSSEEGPCFDVDHV